MRSWVTFGAVVVVAGGLSLAAGPRPRPAVSASAPTTLYVSTWARKPTAAPCVGPPPGLHSDVQRDFSGPLYGSSASYLSHVVQPPWATGFLRGRIEGPARPHVLASTGGRSGRYVYVECTVVTDWSLRVTGWVGVGTTPYPLGTLVTLRLEGGAIGAFVETVNDLPDVAPSMDLFALVWNQGTYLIDRPDVLRDDIRGQIFPVVGGDVTSQVDPTYREPVAAFERRVLGR